MRNEPRVASTYEMAPTTLLKRPLLLPNLLFYRVIILSYFPESNMLIIFNSGEVKRYFSVNDRWRVSPS